MRNNASSLNVMFDLDYFEIDTETPSQLINYVCSVNGKIMIWFCCVYLVLQTSEKEQNA